MRNPELILVGCALDVLRDALERARFAPVQDSAVRLALRVLLPHCPERWPLVSFWEGAGTVDGIGRRQSCNAALNAIERQLRLSGALEDCKPPCP